MFHILLDGELRVGFTKIIIISSAAVFVENSNGDKIYARNAKDVCVCW